MDALEISVLTLAALFVLTLIGAAVGMFTENRNYIPMSPDEEYRWLCDDYGLSHEEAREVMRPLSHSDKREIR